MSHFSLKYEIPRGASVGEEWVEELEELSNISRDLLIAPKAVIKRSSGKGTSQRTSGPIGQERSQTPPPLEPAYHSCKFLRQFHSQCFQVSQEVTNVGNVKATGKTVSHFHGNCEIHKKQMGALSTVCKGKQISQYT